MTERSVEKKNKHKQAARTAAAAMRQNGRGDLAVRVAVDADGMPRKIACSTASGNGGICAAWLSFSAWLSASGRLGSGS